MKISQKKILKEYIKEFFYTNKINWDNVEIIREIIYRDLHFRVIKIKTRLNKIILSIIIFCIHYFDWIFNYAKKSFQVPARKYFDKLLKKLSFALLY